RSASSETASRKRRKPPCARPINYCFASGLLSPTRWRGLKKNCRRPPSWNIWCGSCAPVRGGLVSKQAQKGIRDARRGKCAVLLDPFRVNKEMIDFIIAVHLNCVNGRDGFIYC